MKLVHRMLGTMFCLVLLMVGAASAPSAASLESANWDPQVKACVNEMLASLGRGGAAYNPSLRPYAVFDFDNTVSILDVEEQLAIYQLERMRFAVAPGAMYEVLTTGIPDVDKDLGEEYGHLTVAKVARDAAAAYEKLCAAGYVAADGSKAERVAQCQASDDWKEFATKARWLYDAIGDSFDVSVSYPWITYWFTGMTPNEVFALAREAFQYYARQSADPAYWKKVTWTSPEKYEGSVAGQLKIKHNQGVTVSAEMKELIAALAASGIDVWVCSASFIDVINAALQPDTFGISGVTGFVAMTNKVGADGRYLNAYDYDFHAQTQGPGKTATVAKLLVPLYNGAGPVFVAGDSQGDFNFMTEFASIRCALILNRARKDDAGLLAAIAAWQNEQGMSVAAANEKGDMRVLLQGRDENGGRFWARPQVLRLGKDKEEFLSGKAEGWLEKLKAGTTPAELLNAAPQLTGKLKEYAGYRSIK